jgi:hypothetical protein
MATGKLIALWICFALAACSGAYATVSNRDGGPPPLGGAALGVYLNEPYVLSSGGDTVWLQVHIDSSSCPGDPGRWHGGEATGGPGPLETWCFENGPGDSCGTNPPWDTRCFTHVDVRTHSSPTGANYWHIDTYCTDQRSYCGDYALWCGSDSLWIDGNPVECGTWKGSPPGYGDMWNCRVELSLPDTFSVAAGCTLLFDPRYDTECKYDYFYLDVWDGSDWVTLASFNASSNNAGGVCGNPGTANPDYWGNTDTGQPYSADWQERFDPDLPAFYRVVTPDTLGVTSGPRFRWRFVSDGAWSDADGRGDTDGAAFIDNVWVWCDNMRYQEDFESGSLDTIYWRLPNPEGVIDQWHIVSDTDPPYEGGDGGDRGSCTLDSSYAYRARPEAGYPGDASWRNGWYYRLQTPSIPIQNSGCIVQYDFYCLVLDYTCDYGDARVRFHSSEYNQWCPWADFGRSISWCSSFFWGFDNHDDVTPWYDSTADSMQFAWDFFDVSQPSDFCYGKHKKSDFLVDNVSIGFFDADATIFWTRRIDLLHDTFLTGICGYNSDFDAYDADTVDYYWGSGAPPIRWNRQLRMDVLDKDGLTAVQLCGSIDDGANWVSKGLTLKYPRYYGQPELGGEYYGTLCPSDFGDTAWVRGTVVRYYVKATDDLANDEYYPSTADPGSPYHTGCADDYLTFTIMPRYPGTYTGPRILLVDGYGRRNYNWSPCLSVVDNQIELERLYGDVLTDAGYCYDRFDIEGAGSNVNLNPIRFADYYDAIVWTAGTYFSNYLIDKEAQEAIRDFLVDGGKVVLLGDRLAYNMGPAQEGCVGEDSLGGEFLSGVMGCDYQMEMESPFAKPHVYLEAVDSITVLGTPMAVALDSMLVYRQCPSLKDMSYVRTNPMPPVGYTAQALLEVLNPDPLADPSDGAIYVERPADGGQCVFVNYDLSGFINQWGTWCNGDAQEPAPDFAAGTYDGRAELMRVILEDIFGLPAGSSGGPAGIDEPPVAYRWHLAQNTPNPCVRATEIRYSLGRRSPVRLVVYDVLGREVRVLEDGVIGAGEHRAVWDGCNDLGKRVTSGVYFYKLEAGDHQFTRKMLVVR